MNAAQLFQIGITVLFVAVLVELLAALTLFHIRMFREERQRKKKDR